MPRLVVGLGNPGPEYLLTRHNAGFLAVDLLAENLRAAYWKDEAGARVATVRFGDDDLVLAEPQAFMNVSGKAVARLLAAYDVPVAELVVVHDDIDLPEGTVRAKSGGGHGGHNGLRSVSEVLESGDYLRVRIGIGRPPGRMDPADYVLQPLRKDAAEALVAVVPTAAQCVMHILEHGIDSAMREYNSD
jgi:PTH1 family peptidyl-tRNA hydrolase